MPFKRDDHADYASFSGLLTPEEVSLLAGDVSLRILQFDKPVHPDNWLLLEEGLFTRRPDICLRAYAHDKRVCDVSFVTQVPSLQDFKADCLRKVSGLQALAELPNLRHMGIGVDALESFDFLSTVSTGLKTLAIGPTLSTKPDVSVVSRFQQLEQLSIDGHYKGMEVLASHPNLGVIRFRGLKSPNLDFLSEMPKLWSLAFHLGGTEDLSAISGVTGLKDLDLTWIRRLKDIAFISGCVNLQRLRLDRLRQVEVLPNFENLTKLRRLIVAELKGLKSLDPIAAAPALEVFSGSAGPLEPEDYRTMQQAPSLRRATVFFESRKKEREFDAIAAEYGVSTEVVWEEFVFNS